MIHKSSNIIEWVWIHLAPWKICAPLKNSDNTLFSSKNNSTSNLNRCCGVSSLLDCRSALTLTFISSMPRIGTAIMRCFQRKWKIKPQISACEWGWSTKTQTATVNSSATRMTYLSSKFSTRSTTCLWCYRPSAASGRSSPAYSQRR